MPNSSATGGYLSPAVASPPLEDDALEDVFQAALAGITGLSGAFVRPRWQPNPPKQPDPSVNWCAFGITAQRPDANGYIKHIPAGNGSDKLIRHEDIELLATFYGPLAQRYASMLRDGLLIAQNMEALRASGIAYVDAGDIRPAPELVNQQWVKRFDLPLRFRREIKRDYAILNIAGADIGLIDDSGHVDELIVVQP